MWADMNQTGLVTTFDQSKRFDYKKALTQAKPDPDGNALWYRLPEDLKKSLENKKEELSKKIKIALSDKKNSKTLIKEVFVELLLSLETWFTQQQVVEIVENLDKFDNDLIIPIEDLDWIDNTHLFEQFHWPTDAFKDIALQMVTSMASIIVKEENEAAIAKAKEWERWQKLKFVITQTSTSGDTGPAWGSWIQGKDFTMNVIGFPENEATYSQKWQMMNLWENVMAIAMNTSFSNIQEWMFKWNTPEFRQKLKEVIEKELSTLIEKYGFEIEIDSWSFNSINPWRVDWQTLYHSYWMLQAQSKGIIKEWEEIIEVIPSWNGGHMYSSLMARLQTWQKWKTIVTCNRNNMFYKIIEEWKFTKTPENSAIDEPSVSMIIEYPNNMIRLFAYAFGEKRAEEITTDFFAWKEVVFSQRERNILTKDLWLVPVEISWNEELITVWETFETTGKLICPHTANAIAWLQKYRDNSWDKQTQALISATASPWKFLAATATGLSYKETKDVEWMYKKYKELENSKEWTAELLKIIQKKYKTFWKEFNMDILPENLRLIYENWYQKWEVVSPEKFWEKTLEFLEKSVAPQFRKQVEALLED